MKVAGGGFERCDNARAVAATGSIKSIMGYRQCLLRGLQNLNPTSC